MHIFVSFPLDDSVSESVVLSNVRKGLGSLGKECDLLTLPPIESESIDCLFDAEERVLALECLLEDAIRKYLACYSSLSSAGISDTVVLGKTFDHFLKSFQWNTIKYPLSSKMSSFLTTMEEEVAEFVEALKEKEASYAEEKKRKDLTMARPAYSKEMHMYEIDIDALEYNRENGELFSPFFKRYYIGSSDKLRAKDVAALFEIDGLFIESRSLAKKCVDGEIYEAFGRADTEAEIVQNIEKCGFSVLLPQLSRDAYFQKKSKFLECLALIKKLEVSLVEMILGRIPKLHSLLLHIKYISLYIESVLRYGLPPLFCVFIMENHNPSKVLLKWKKISASWKYSTRMACSEKAAALKGLESMYCFVYKTIGNFCLVEPCSK